MNINKFPYSVLQCMMFVLNKHSDILILCTKKTGNGYNVLLSSVHCIPQGIAHTFLKILFTKYSFVVELQSLMSVNYEYTFCSNSLGN